MNEMEVIKNILENHHGKVNPVTSAKIAIAIGNPNEDDTHASTRFKIKNCMKLYNLPVLSYNKGYYYAKTEDELAEYINNLDKRIAGIKERKIIVLKNFVEANK
jgi:hypothetical protein